MFTRHSAIEDKAMKKTFIVIMLMAVGINVALSQPDYVRYLHEISPCKYDCLYEYTVTSENESGDTVKDNICTILQIGKTISKFEDYKSYQFDSIRISEGTADSVRYFLKMFLGAEANCFFDPEIYVDLKEEKLSHYENIATIDYLYEETFPIQKWLLVDDTLTVCGYHCNKATTEYGGRKWTAWYTTELPLPYGPWKLFGLPGLILQAEDCEKTHKFSAYSFRKSNVSIFKVKNAPHKCNRETLLKSKSKFAKFKDPYDGLDNIHLSTIAGTLPGAGYRACIINGIALRFRTHKYIPLELK